MNNIFEIKELFVREDGIIDETTETANKVINEASRPENYYG
jgi:hypothetical protein